MVPVAIVAVAFLLGALILFPFVGIALLPVALLGVLVVVARAFVVARRGPNALPERTTSPEEPSELGRERRSPSA